LRGASDLSKNVLDPAKKGSGNEDPTPCFNINKKASKKKYSPNKNYWQIDRQSIQMCTPINLLQRLETYNFND